MEKETAGTADFADELCTSACGIIAELAARLKNARETIACLAAERDSLAAENVELLAVADPEKCAVMLRRLETVRQLGILKDIECKSKDIVIRNLKAELAACRGKEHESEHESEHENENERETENETENENESG